MKLIIFSGVLTGCTLLLAAISWLIWERKPKTVEQSVSGHEMGFPRFEILTLKTFLRDATPSAISSAAEEETIFEDPNFRYDLLQWMNRPERAQG